ncbi:hypothetical protein GA707_07445 [Nostocoides sp. F2B08]|uniref:hypothetical protein n=1 Tax=Nostocoides sp. F2B08 TaxID=2653936 RepID=UPI001262BE5D|nr:hypothetical protein [Tetrasphaera sp. F2B08]KAB7744453.1 hypothetical protein GA707_07445 [Tetrasphaera sp. F2B08]
MDTTVWEHATASSAQTDRRESRVVLRAAIVAGMVLVLIIGANQLGLTRPAIASTGTTVTAVDAEPSKASIYLDVRNRGILTERLDAIEIDYPGLTIRDARFIPQTLGAFDTGQVAIDVTIDCAARLPGGEPAWAQTATQTQEPAIRLATTRPWGAVGAPWGRVSDTLPGWDIGWSILNGASGACDPS